MQVGQKAVRVLMPRMVVVSPIISPAQLTTVPGRENLTEHNNCQTSQNLSDRQHGEK